MPLPTNIPRSPAPSEPTRRPAGRDETGLPQVSPPKRESRPAPPPPPAEEEPFTPIDVSDPSLYDEEEDEQFTPPPNRGAEGGSTPRRTSRPSRVPELSLSDDDEDEVAVEAQARRVEAANRKRELPAGETEDTFIDKEKGKLKPFGRSAGRKVRVNELDSRNNLRRRSQMVQMAVIGLLAILVLLGLKNALIPPETLSDEEVAGIVTQTIGTQGYPVERGGAFAQDFMKAYLAIGDDANNNATLNFFYTGNFGPAEAQSRSRTLNRGFQQTVLSGPTLYQSRALTPTSASYVFGAVVLTESEESPAPPDQASAKMSFFNVNVYYNTEVDSFSITPDSPAVVPPITSLPQTSVPQSGEIGTGTATEEARRSVESLVHGFVRGYAISSPEDHSAIDQYIIPSPPPELVQGLEGRYTLPEQLTSAVSYTLYTTADPNEYKAKVDVTWTDSVSSTVSANYNSSYIMTLVSQGNDKFLVSKFAPYYYTEKED